MNIHVVIRWLVIALVLLAVISGVVILLWRLGMQRSAGWQEKLDWYVDLLNQDDGRIVSVHETVRARMPERFSAEMSTSTWGDSLYFNTDYGSQGPRKPDFRPLSFPPAEVWCAVLIDKYTTDPALNVPNTYRAVLIARHGDMYMAEWVVHTLLMDGNLEAAETQRVLSEVGCQFKHMPISDGLRQMARRLPAHRPPASR